MARSVVADQVQSTLDALARPEQLPRTAIGALARQTPAGVVDLPLEIVDLVSGVERAVDVDRAWLAEVDRRRSRCRFAALGRSGEAQVEEALSVVLLAATDRFDPADAADVAAHTASGARLWLLAGAVCSALSGDESDPFAAWAALVTGGWWPIGPCGGRLVVSAP